MPDGILTVLACVALVVAGGDWAANADPWGLALAVVCGAALVIEWLST